MKRSVDKLRWLLAGGSLLLLVVLVGAVGYGRYRAAKAWKERLNKLGVHINRDTEGFTYSQTLKGRTVFTLHAAKASRHEDGKVMLHDVVLTLYGSTPERADRISGADFEYDEKEGVARALGDVQMDLQLPSGLAKSHQVQTQASAAGGDRNMHVRTSGLVYVRKLGVAATDQRVEFRYAGLQCSAQGAEFDTSASTVRLLANVEASGAVSGKPLTLHAAKADLYRENNLVSLVQPVINSAGKLARAATASVFLRKDGSLDHAEAGTASMEEGTKRVTAGRLQATFGTDNLPQHAVLTENVTLDDTDSKEPTHGSAQDAELSFGAKGMLSSFVAQHGVRVCGNTRGADGSMYARALQGERVDASFVPAKDRGRAALQQLTASGSASLYTEQPSKTAGRSSAERKSVQLAANTIQARFAPGESKTPELQEIAGTGQARLEQRAPGGEQESSASDTLQVLFAKGGEHGTPEIASVTQTGHVAVETRPAERTRGSKQEPVSASAEVSIFQAVTGTFTLTGAAHVTQGNLSITAASVTVEQRSGDTEATGGVVGTVLQADHTGAQATHIAAASAYLKRLQQVAEFHGAVGKPARLWQGSSQVEADSLIFDGKRKALAARRGTTGKVRAVFAAETRNVATGPGTVRPTGSSATGSASERMVAVSANSMDYGDTERTATFSGDVKIAGEDGTAAAQHAVAFFSPAGKAKQVAVQKRDRGAGDAFLPEGSLQRVVLWEGVRLTQPERSGSGDRLVYTAADASYVLTGKPGAAPQIVDAKHGTVTGAALLFRANDSAVIVSGNALGESNGRVRTETGAKQ